LNVNHLDKHKESALFYAKDAPTCVALLEVRCDPRLSVTKTKKNHVLEKAQLEQHRGEYLSRLLRAFPTKNTKSEYGHMVVGENIYTANVGDPDMDVDSLVSLEQEFVDDHVAMLDPEGHFDRPHWSKALGINGGPKVRRKVISRILQAGHNAFTQIADIPNRWTIVCRHYPSNAVVGFAHYVLEVENPAPQRQADGQPLLRSRRVCGQPKAMFLYIGYLKVSRQHMRRGVASLLLAAIPKHLAQVAERCRRTHPLRYEELQGFSQFSRHISLSVAALNPAAIAVYQKLGFWVDCESEDTEPGSINWCRMIKNSQATFDNLIADWDVFVGGHTTKSLS